MIDAAVPRAGLLPVSKNANAYGGRSWTQSEHELDRVYSRKGIAYGVEIKNTLDYIPKSELDIKLAMSGYLGLVPIFVVRMAPKSYVHLVQQAGGFTWIMKYQFYPFGHEELAREVRAALGFPVDSPRSLQDGTLKRLVEFVERKEREFGR